VIEHVMKTAPSNISKSLHSLTKGLSWAPFACAWRPLLLPIAGIGPMAEVARVLLLA
jgi:hypothetical protein